MTKMWVTTLRCGDERLPQVSNTRYGDSHVGNAEFWIRIAVFMLTTIMDTRVVSCMIVVVVETKRQLT